MEQGDAGGQAGRGAAAGGRNNPQSLIVVGNRGLALGLGAVRHREDAVCDVLVVQTSEVVDPSVGTT